MGSTDDRAVLRGVRGGARGPARRDPGAAHAAARPGLTAVLRLATRAVRWLHAHGLGRLLGQRVLLLQHTGRRSGRPYTTPLEIVGRAPAGAPVVVAGLGDGDWLRNLAAGGPAAATVGRTTGPVVDRIRAAQELPMVALEVP